MDIRQEVRGAHHGQLDCTLKMTNPAGAVIGFLHYAVYEEIPSIQMIEVHEDHRRSGHATRLLSCLQEHHPDQEIDWGSLTTDGVALYDALPVRLIPTSHADALARLDRLKARLDEMSAKIERLQRENLPQKAEITAYYCLESHVDHLAWQLDGMRASHRILDLAA